MSDELREKLSNEVGDAHWADLRLHHEKGALLRVDGQLDLIEAGIALAGDDVARVTAWMAADQLQRPTPEEAEHWAKGDRPLRFLIVQPWVLVQEKPLH